MRALPLLRLCARRFPPPPERLPLLGERARRLLRLLARLARLARLPRRLLRQALLLARHAVEVRERVRELRAKGRERGLAVGQLGAKRSRLARRRVLRLGQKRRRRRLGVSRRRRRRRELALALREPARRLLARAVGLVRLAQSALREGRLASQVLAEAGQLRAGAGAGAAGVGAFFGFRRFLPKTFPGNGGGGVSRRERLLRSKLRASHPFLQRRARRLGVLRARAVPQSLGLRLGGAARGAARRLRHLRHLAPRRSVGLVRLRARLGEPRGDGLELASELRLDREPRGGGLESGARSGRVRRFRVRRRRPFRVRRTFREGADERSAAAIGGTLSHGFQLHSLHLQHAELRLDLTRSLIPLARGGVHRRERRAHLRARLVHRRGGGGSPRGSGGRRVLAQARELALELEPFRAL